MRNLISKGTEGIMVNNHKSPYIPFPINEDWVMVMEVLAVNNGIVTATKVWDNSTSKRQYHAKLLYAGESTDVTPADSLIKVNSYVVFYRCGEYNSSGSTEPELRTEDENNYSWICFVSPSSTILVKDKGDGTAVEVSYNSDGTTTEIGSPKEIITADPGSFFHNNTAPFAVDRIYAAKYIEGDSQNEAYYVVFLPGQGKLEKTFNQSAGDIILELDVDGQGNVLDFRAI